MHKITSSSLNSLILILYNHLQWVPSLSNHISRAPPYNNACFRECGGHTYVDAYTHTERWATYSMLIFCVSIEDRPTKKKIKKSADPSFLPDLCVYSSQKIYMNKKKLLPHWLGVLAIFARFPYGGRITTIGSVYIYSPNTRRITTKVRGPETWCYSICCLLSLCARAVEHRALHIHFYSRFRFRGWSAYNRFALVFFFCLAIGVRTIGPSIFVDLIN